MTVGGRFSGISIENGNLLCKMVNDRLSRFMDELLTEYMLLDFVPVQSTISSSFSTEATAFCPSIEILSDF